VWKTYELELINYQSKCRLIRGWDDLFNKVKEHINSVAAMKLSPYYKVLIYRTFLSILTTRYLYRTFLSILTTRYLYTGPFYPYLLLGTYNISLLDMQQDMKGLS